jgi:hypothetical protein
MIKELLKFHHDSDNVPVAMGFTEEMDSKCREIIHFSAFTNYFIKKDFFNEEEDAPTNLMTITGILEKALNICQTEEEKVYTLFVFRNVHKHCSQAIGAWEAYYDEADEKQRKKMKMLIELVELKALTEDEDRETLVTPKDMFKKITAAKDNMYNFDKYYSVVNESKN